MTEHTVIRHTNYVFGATVTKAMTSRTGGTIVWGTGEEARDLLYIDDLVRFVEFAIDFQHSPYEMFHASAGHAIRINDLVARVVAASGRSLRIEHDLKGPTIATSFALDNRRAKELPGWEPQVPFDEGVRRTVDWWRAAHGGAR